MVKRFALPATAALAIAALLATPAADLAASTTLVAAPPAAESLVVSETFDVKVAQAREVCIKISTPKGSKKACRTVPPLTDAKKFRFCVTLKSGKYRGQTYCRKALVRPEKPIIDLTPDPTPDPGPDPAPAPTPPMAPPFTPPNLNDPSLVGSTTDYTLLNVTSSGEPLRRDPCSTLTYRAEGDANQRRIVEEALNTWTLATGITLKELPPAEPGDPMLAGLEIRWSTPEENEGLRGGEGYEILGRATTSFSRPHWMDFTIVTIRENLPTFLTDSYDEEWLWRAVILHELGHAAGLAHASRESNQVMTPGVRYDRYQRGDLSGLAFISSFRECRPSPYRF